jgi:hypothetical protein
VVRLCLAVSVNGLLPNLDLLNAAARIFRWNGGPDVLLVDPTEFGRTVSVSVSVSVSQSLSHLVLFLL